MKYKKIPYLLLIILLLTSCSDKEIDNTLNNVEETNEIEDITPVEPVYIDENPVKVGLYQIKKNIK